MVLYMCNLESQNEKKERKTIWIMVESFANLIKKKKMNPQFKNLKNPMLDKHKQNHGQSYYSQTVNN